MSPQVSCQWVRAALKVEEFRRKPLLGIYFSEDCQIVTIRLSSLLLAQIRSKECCGIGRLVGVPHHRPQPELSLFLQKQIEHPTSAYMLSRPPAVFQDVRIAAAGGFQGIGENRHFVEAAVVVDALCGAAD